MKADLLIKELKMNFRNGHKMQLIYKKEWRKKKRKNEEHGWAVNILKQM